MTKRELKAKEAALFVVMYMARQGALACHAAASCSRAENGVWRGLYTRAYRMEQEGRLKTYINDEGPKL